MEVPLTNEKPWNVGCHSTLGEKGGVVVGLPQCHRGNLPLNQWERRAQKAGNLRTLFVATKLFHSCFYSFIVKF